jgi:hypothetical protein
LSAPRLSSLRWEPEGKISFAITTDALMKPRQNEPVASRRVSFAGMRVNGSKFGMKIDILNHVLLD